MKSNQKLRSLCKNKAGYVGAIGGLVALLLTIIIGVLIFYEVADSIDLVGAGYDAKNTTTDMAATVFSLLPIVALVIVAGIILAVVLGFGGNKRGGM